ncbi:hypothetical protein H4R35_001067 [Dimargaris xerosporica]|nr:hypothetical protein H4R35_001067 [Dimargaris xerosporica]
MTKHRLAELNVDGDVTPSNQHQHKRTRQRGERLYIQIEPSHQFMTFPRLVSQDHPGASPPLPHKTNGPSELSLRLLNAPPQPPPPVRPPPSIIMPRYISLPSVQSLYPPHPTHPTEQGCCPCPKCKMCTLRRQGTVITCPCGVAIDTGDDAYDPMDVTRRLENMHYRHTQVCPSEPVVVIKNFVDLDNQSLVLCCAHCHLNYILV